MFDASPFWDLLVQGDFLANTVILVNKAISQPRPKTLAADGKSMARRCEAFHILRFHWVAGTGPPSYFANRTVTRKSAASP